MSGVPYNFNAAGGQRPSMPWQAPSSQLSPNEQFLMGINELMAQTSGSVEWAEGIALQERRREAAQAQYAQIQQQRQTVLRQPGQTVQQPTTPVTQVPNTATTQQRAGTQTPGVKSQGVESESYTPSQPSAANQITSFVKNQSMQSGAVSSMGTSDPYSAGYSDPATNGYVDPSLSEFQDAAATYDSMVNSPTATTSYTAPSGSGNVDLSQQPQQPQQQTVNANQGQDPKTITNGNAYVVFNDNDKQSQSYLSSASSVYTFGSAGNTLLINASGKQGTVDMTNQGSGQNVTKITGKNNVLTFQTDASDAISLPGNKENWTVTKGTNKGDIICKDKNGNVITINGGSKVVFGDGQSPDDPWSIVKKDNFDPNVANIASDSADPADIAKLDLSNMKENEKDYVALQFVLRCTNDFCHPANGENMDDDTYSDDDFKLAAATAEKSGNKELSDRINAILEAKNNKNLTMYDGNPGDDNKMSRDELKGILASERNGMTLKDITDQTSKMPVIRL